MDLSRIKVHTEKYDKKRAIKDFQSKYSNKFEMESDRVDLRAMSENYDNGLIPLDDIHKCLNVVTDNQFKTTDLNEYDPELNSDNLSPKFTYLQWDELFLMPKFQRDVVAKHIKKILNQFDASCVVVPCAVKLNINNQLVYVVWDGHHTLQAMKYRNYTQFPIWYIDITNISADVIKNAGFPITPIGYIDYAIWRAGTNMRFINSKLKLPLHPYDDFMIGYDIKDTKCVAVMNIFKKYNVIPAKKETRQKYELLQIKSAFECYDLQDSNGNMGIFLDRSLNFHTKTWAAPIELEVFRPMAYLYHRASIEGKVLDSTFDKQMGDMLVKKYGPTSAVQEQLKASYYLAWSQNLGVGAQLSSDKDRVTDGLINLFNQTYPNNNYMPMTRYKWQVL